MAAPDMNTPIHRFLGNWLDDLYKSASRPLRMSYIEHLRNNGTIDELKAAIAHELQWVARDEHAADLATIRRYLDNALLKENAPR
jgi:hypothetical protein